MLQTCKAHQPGPQGPPESVGRWTGGEDQLQGRLVDADQGGGEGCDAEDEPLRRQEERGAPGSQQRQTQSRGSREAPGKHGG